MNLAAAPLWCLLLAAALLGAAAIEDAVRMRIANLTSGGLLLSAIAAAVALGPQWSLWQNAAVFAALLALGTALFSIGKLGGGDVKLLAAAGFWFPIAGAIKLIVLVTLAGGVVALLVIAARTLARRRGKDDKRPRILVPGSGIPYGVAIAAGALLALYLERPAAPAVPDPFAVPRS